MDTVLNMLSKPFKNLSHANDVMIVSLKSGATMPPPSRFSMFYLERRDGGTAQHFNREQAVRRALKSQKKISSVFSGQMFIPAEQWGQNLRVGRYKKTQEQGLNMHFHVTM